MDDDKIGIGGILLACIAGAGAVALIGENRREAAKEKKRINTPCKFLDGLTEEDFRIIVKNAAKGIKRIYDLQIDGPSVAGTATSQSGLTEWNFVIDFNDYGHVTGKYWIKTENNDSIIPTILAKRIADEISKRNA